MPIYPKNRKQRKDNRRWRVRVWKGGQTHDLIVHGTYEDAQTAEAKLRLELGAKGPKSRAPVPTFSEFSLGRYADEARLRLKQSTWSVRRYQIATLVEHFGDRRLDAITTERVQAFMHARVVEKMRPTTVNNELAVLQAILAFARKIELPAATPLVEPLPVRTRRHASAWTDADMNRLLVACKRVSPALLPVVLFLANTGARKGEALALRWSDVDRIGPSIRIAPNEEWQPKDGDARTVPISKSLLATMRAAATSEKWVFPASTGERYAFWPRKQFDRVVTAAKLTGGPHKLRHTFASHFLAKKPDLPLLSRLLGHSDVRITERVYAHLLPEHHASARNVVSFAPPDLRRVA